jgi:hypothetical protein
MRQMIMDNNSSSPQRSRERGGNAERGRERSLGFSLRFLRVLCSSAAPAHLAAFLIAADCNISIAGGLSVNEVLAPQQPGPKRPGDYIPQGPKRPGVIEPAEAPQTIREGIRAYRAPQKGALVLFTTPKARVKLIPQSGRNQASRSGNANDHGVCLFPNLSPGSYELQITGDDYEPLTGMISIEKGRPTGLNGTLIPKYGALMLALPEQEGVVIRLDGELLATERLKLEGGAIKITRIGVGEHVVKLSKPGYEDWSRQIEIKPGEVADNKISVVMEPVTVRLTVKSLPQSEVYVDNLLRGAVGADGALLIPDLEPGARTLKVKLAGYQTIDRSLTLSPERREVEETVNLISILETAEFNEGFKENIKNWTMTWPPGWELPAIPQRGLRITGGALALVNNTTIPNQPFNQYGDFLLLLNVKFANGKGASWVVRAQDDENFYLFELATSKGKNQEKAWNFYICRDGNCALKDSQPCLADIEKPESYIRISLEAKGNSFALKIPSQGDKGTGPTFTDDTFRYGGIGIRAINGLEMFVTEFFIKPNV